MSSIKIEKLTEKQIAKFPEYVDKWTKIGLCTEPADRKMAEKGIKEAYKIAGLKAPRIVWCGSPMSMALTRAIICEKFPKIQGKNKIDSVRASVRASVGDSVGASVRASVRASVGASVRDSVRASVWDSVGDSVGDSVWDSVRDSVRDSVGDSVGDSGYGQQDANWLGFYDYFYNECKLKKETEKLKGLWMIAKSANWFLPHEKICWISERPCELYKDDSGRLHNTKGMALKYPDGWGIYSYHGTRLVGDKEYIISNPEQITVEKIDNEENIDIRRIMVDMYGIEKYLKDSNAEIISKDKFGELYKKEVNNDEPIVMVKLLNSTPEKDGSKKTYFLRVPQDIKTPHEAVAWSFGLSTKEYNPLIES